jgi:phosphate uptake regulator
MKIKKNDPLGLLVQEDGTLLVTPNTSLEQVKKTKEINLEGVSSAGQLFRLLISAYVTGYAIIKVTSKTRIPPELRETVMKFNRAAIGPEIIEEKPDSITIKDLLNPAEMPFDKTIKRMYNLVRVMHSDAVTALNKKDVELAKDVVERDFDVDRLHWLIYRQFSMVERDVTLSKKRGLTQEEATYYFLISRTMERIGDHAVIIAQNVPAVLEGQVNEKTIKTISSASETALNMLDNGMKSWMEKDLELANNNIKSLKKLYPFFEKINRAATKNKKTPSVELAYIAESLRRTGEYTGNISELVMNKLVSE